MLDALRPRVAHGLAEGDAGLWLDGGVLLASAAGLGEGAAADGDGVQELGWVSEAGGWLAWCHEAGLQPPCIPVWCKADAQPPPAAARRAGTWGQR
ncbi:hypothetical protein GCM10018966_066380 [Streptomyces yanii]